MSLFTMTEEEYRERSNDYEGLCIYCKSEAFDIEPDARGYECEECEEHGVYGMEELLLMGAIQFEEDTE